MLTLWSRLLCAERYVQNQQAITESSYFNECVPRLIQAYISGRLETVDDYIDDATNNPLSDTESLAIEMQQLPQIVRYCYDVNSRYICERFDPLYEQYKVNCSIVLSISRTCYYNRIPSIHPPLNMNSSRKK